jgi:hypothetical protein
MRGLPIESGTCGPFEFSATAGREVGPGHLISGVVGLDRGLAGRTCPSAARLL